MMAHHAASFVLTAHFTTVVLASSVLYSEQLIQTAVDFQKMSPKYSVNVEFTVLIGTIAFILVHFLAPSEKFITAGLEDVAKNVMNIFFPSSEEPQGHDIHSHIRFRFSPLAYRKSRKNESNQSFVVR